MARFKKGDYKVQCDSTGAIVNASDCRMTYDGKFVHKNFWYPKHPQETPLVVSETRKPAILRPEGEPRFIDPTSVTAEDL